MICGASRQDRRRVAGLFRDITVEKKYRDSSRVEPVNEMATLTFVTPYHLNNDIEGDILFHETVRGEEQESFSASTSTNGAGRGTSESSGRKDSLPKLGCIPPSFI